jgi:hypothetical protein
MVKVLFTRVCDPITVGLRRAFLGSDGRIDGHGRMNEGIRFADCLEALPALSRGT